MAVIDMPSAPRSIDDGIVIYVCEHDGTVRTGEPAFVTTVKDPPKARPTCPTCGGLPKHVGHETVMRLMNLK